MKILYGITKSNFGGAQRYVFDLAREAKALGHDVAVLCGEGGALVEKLETENIRTIVIPGFSRDIDLLNDAPRLLFIIKTVRALRPDVFHINSAKMGGAGIFTGRLLGIKKIIFTAHGWAFNEERPWFEKVIIKFLTWVTILCAHKTICVSEKSKTDVQSWPFVKRKLFVVRNGIEAFDLLSREDARRDLEILDDKTLVVGALSELHPIKGLDVLIQAWGKFSQNHNAKLLIFGEGEERSKLEKQIKYLDLSDSVLLKGFVPDAKKYLKAFDIFALPSRSENLPYAVLEAGFAELPVVASEVGGTPEIIETGTSGVLIKPEDSEILFSTLLLLSENEDLRKRLGSKLKETILKDFTLKKMSSDTIKTYES